MKFTFRDEWWHANTSPGPVPHPLHIPVPTYRRCHADPAAPFAEPA